MRSLTLPGVVLALCAAAAPALAQVRPATCARDLLQNEAALHRQQRLLTGVANADLAAQCKVWRDHVGFLQSSRAVFATCQSGAQREQNVATMDSDLADYRVLLSSRCGKR